MKKCFTINPMRTRDEFLSYSELIKEGIFQAIEIFYPYNQDKAQYDQYTSSVKELITLYKDLEVVLHLPHGVKDGIVLDEHLKNGSLELMFKASDYAALFHAKKLTLHLGHIDQSIERKYYVDKVIPTLRTLCDYVKKNNQVIMIENMPGPGELGYSPDELKEIIERVERPNLKFIFDTGHAHCSSYPDTDFLYLLKDYLYHIHYNDNDGTRDMHARLGTGNIDFKAHFKALKDINYQELHCMEVIYKTSDDLRLYASDLDKLGS